MNLKKNIGTVVTSKFVETGPSFYEKQNLPGRGLTKVEKHCCSVLSGFTACTIPFKAL